MSDKNPNIDHLIEETEQAIENTRSFLESLSREDREKQAGFVEEVQQRFEKDLRRLLHKKEEATKDEKPDQELEYSITLHG